MLRSYLLLCLFGIFVAGIVARVAIIDGKKAREEQLPYQASVEIPDFGHHCGGGIIGERHILTAAHCVTKLNRDFRDNLFTVLVGTTNRYNDTSPAVRVQVAKIYIPDEYDPRHETFLGDIAVLKLKHALPFSKHIEKLNLPAHKDLHYAGEVAEIAGWGWDWIITDGEEIHSGGRRDGDLRYAEVDVLAQCHEHYDPAVIREKEICGKVREPDPNKPRGVCHGDSGGVLVHQNTAIGVLSTSPWHCSEKLDSTLYTRVAHYLDFIQNAIHDRHSDDIRTKVLHA